MNKPHDPNVTVDLLPATVDALDAHRTGALDRPVDPLPTTVTFRPSDAPDADTPASSLPVVPGYRVQREIACGSMGRVLAAFDLVLDRAVALKILLPGANADRFVREAKITARLPHPGIPPVHALGTLADGSPFLVMKLIAGRTLAEEMKTADRPRLLQACTQVCQAVGFAHSRGVIHRDLKPANIMVGAFGEVQVMDWGLAKDLSGPEVAGESCPTTDRDSGEAPEYQTLAGTVIGTPAYMAPEQARGEVVDARADVFALGGILCAILTGQPPFRGMSALEILHRARSADLAEANAGLAGCGADAELVALCRRCLGPSPVGRPLNGQTMADELTVYLNGLQDRLQAVERERAVSLAREAEQRKRRRVQLTLSAAVLLVLTAGIAVSWWYANEANFQAKEANASANQAHLAEAAEKKAKEEALTLATKEAQAKEQTKQELRRVEWREYAGKLLLAQAAFAENNMPEAFRYLDDCQLDLRGWEYCRLRFLFDRSKQTLMGHTGRVSCVCFSPDGKRILTGGDDGAPKVWDAAKGTEVLSLKGHTKDVTSVCFSPDGKRFFAWHGDNDVLAWSAEDGHPVAADNRPAWPAPRLARSRDGRFAAQLDGETVTIVDLLKPVEPWPLPDAAARKAYHTEQAGLAQKEGKWFAVGFHVGRLLLDDPDNAGLKKRRDEALQKHAGR